jgi:hypothetical protein
VINLRLTALCKTCTSKDPGASSTSGESYTMVLRQFTRSPKKSVRRCARETGISRASVTGFSILYTKWKCYVPSLLRAVIEYSDRRTEFCERGGRGCTVCVHGFLVWWGNIQAQWCSEPTYLHVLVFWKPEHSCWQSSELTRTYSLLWCHPGVLWDRASLIGQLLVLSAATCLKVSIVLAIYQLYGDKEIYCQQDRAPPHYHHDVRAYLDDNFRDRWLGRRRVLSTPTFAWFNYTGLLLVELTEGFSVQN